MVKDNFIKRF